MTPAPDICALILAGGAGRRVGGRDKGLLPWHGKPLIEHVIARLGQQVDDIVISCNRNTNDYAKYAKTIVVDTREDFQGPLAGLEAASAHISSPVIILIACDIPLLPANLVPRLMAPLQENSDLTPDISYAHDGSRDQYLCAAIRKSCLPSLTEFLEKGERAVRLWYKSCNSRSVDFSDQRSAFQNYNELE